MCASSLHVDMPASIEAYYQETGRAGRDGLPAEALMLYGAEDIALRRRFIDESEAPDARKRMERRKLDALLGFAESCQCRRQVLLRYFGDDCEPCGNCDVCLDPPETFDGTIAAQKLLSCIYRTGERFGQAHVIAVLLRRGRRAHRAAGPRQALHLRHRQGARPQRLALDRPPARRPWADRSWMWWATEACRSLAEGRQFLRDKPPLNLRISTRAKPERKPARGRQAKEAIPPTDRALFEALRAKRLELAKAQGVPPYVIFHDKTLAEMAARCPRSAAELAGISGRRRGQARALWRGVPGGASADHRR